MKFNNIQYSLGLFLMVLLPLTGVKSQTINRSDSIKNESFIKDNNNFNAYSDTIAGNADTLEAATDTLQYLKHSPTKAALFSLVLPGLGQAYNKRFWKIPIVYVGFGVAGYYLKTNQDLYVRFRSGYRKFSNNPNDPETTEYIGKLPYKISQTSDKAGALKYYTDLYRTWRDWSVFSLSLIYLLNVIDASVDAYFFYYDISDNLSLKVKPTIINAVGNYSVVGLKLSFDIH